MAEVVDYGRTLQACRNLDGFAGVLQRLKAGDAGALAELKFASSLRDAGYLPVLEPELNGNRLDAVLQERQSEYSLRLFPQSYHKRCDVLKKHLDCLLVRSAHKHQD